MDVGPVDKSEVEVREKLESRHERKFGISYNSPFDVPIKTQIAAGIQDE